MILCTEKSPLSRHSALGFDKCGFYSYSMVQTIVNSDCMVPLAVLLGFWAWLWTLASGYPIWLCWCPACLEFLVPYAVLRFLLVQIFLVTLVTLVEKEYVLRGLGAWEWRTNLPLCPMFSDSVSLVFILSWLEVNRVQTVCQSCALPAL